VAIRSNLCSRTMTGFVLAFLVFHGVSFRSDTCTNRAEFLRGRNHKGRPDRAHPHRKQLAARSPLHDQDAPLTAKLVTALDVILFKVGEMENAVRDAEASSSREARADGGPRLKLRAPPQNLWVISLEETSGLD
jgi:hypothetical protein